jgi:hypothetical protein
VINTNAVRIFQEMETIVSPLMLLAVSIQLVKLRCAAMTVLTESSALSSSSLPNQNQLHSVMFRAMDPLNAAMLITTATQKIAIWRSIKMFSALMETAAPISMIWKFVESAVKLLILDMLAALIFQQWAQDASSPIR